jgi:hypothetical protein
LKMKSVDTMICVTHRFFGWIIWWRSPRVWVRETWAHKRKTRMLFNVFSRIRSKRSFKNLPRQLKGLRLKRSLTTFRFDTILKQGRHNWHVQQANTRGKMMIITLVHQTRNSVVEIDVANKMTLVMRR